MIVKRYPRSHFKREGVICSLGYCEKVNSEYVISLPYKASTMTRLHEYGHAFNEDNDDDITVKEYFNREVRAELFAYNKMGKQLSYRVLFPAIDSLSEYLNTTTLFKFCLESMKEHDIPFTRSDKSVLWEDVKHCCRSNP